MLLCGIIDTLASEEPDTMLSYFFCQATDSRINNATAVLRGLIFVIVSQQPALLKYVRKKYDGSGKALFEDPNAWTALAEIFTNMMKDPSLQGSYLVVDALDECLTGRTQLLEFIIRSATSLPVRWIVASRAWPDIKERLHTATQGVTLCLELNVVSISTAVSRYIRHNVDQLTISKEYDPGIRQAVHHHLSSNADNTFLWVALVCKRLQEIPKRKTIDELRTFPAGLDSLYQRMINSIRDRHSTEAKLYKEILAIASIVFKPITFDELQYFVVIPEDERDDESLASLINDCGSFLNVQDRIIYVIHQSAKDFLVKRVGGEIFPFGREDLHYTIFSQSLQVISKSLRRDIYHLVAPGIHIDKVIHPEPDPLAAIRYPCTYWVDHLCDCQISENVKEDLRDGGSLDKFLRRHYLHWLEALSLLRSMSNGILGVIRLEQLLQVGLLLVNKASKFPKPH